MNHNPYDYFSKTTNTHVSRVINVEENDLIVTKDIYPKVLYFTASWCGPCKKITPVFNELAELNKDIKFFKIDVDKNRELTSSFKVLSMPTFIFFKSKTEINILNGANIDKLIMAINYLNE